MQIICLNRPLSLLFQLVHHHILQFCLSGLFDNSRSEDVIFGLLDCMSRLCSERVDVDKVDEEIQVLIESITKFEEEFKLLMVSVFGYNP